MTSVGGRKQRFCKAQCFTNQLGGEIPTPPFRFCRKSKNRKIKIAPLTKKSLKLKFRHNETFSKISLAAYTDRQDFEKRLLLRNLYFCQEQVRQIFQVQ